MNEKICPPTGVQVFMNGGTVGVLPFVTEVSGKDVEHFSFTGSGKSYRNYIIRMG